MAAHVDSKGYELGRKALSELRDERLQAQQLLTCDRKVADKRAAVAERLISGRLASVLARTEINRPQYINPGP